MTSVFVIDDDADVRELMTLLLREAGYEVRPFGEAQDALRALRAGVVPDVILLDVMMPKMTGWDFRSAIHVDAALSAIPLAIVSGDPLAGKRASEVGAALLKKPFEADDLVSLVEKLASSRPAAATNGAPPR